MMPRVRPLALTSIAMTWLLLSPLLAAEQPVPASAPLPDIPALLRSVELHQAEVDRLRDEYTCRQQQRMVTYDKHGKVKKTEERTSNVFFVHGRPIETLLSKDGKPLSDAELKKEQDHAAKEAVKISAEPADNDKRDHQDEISVSRLLAITRFSNPRRIVEGGRSLIVADFEGDPHAKTRNRGESAVKHVRGTVWIDEEAREVSRLRATVDDPLKIGYGLLATVDTGSHFALEQAFVRNETWLPTSFNARFDGKAALFVGFHVELAVHFDQYQKFHASTTEQTKLPKTN
jgi:hypothetical protein